MAETLIETPNPLDPRTRFEIPGNGILTCCTDNLVVVVGNFKWGKGTTLAEAIANGHFGSYKRGTLTAYIFPGPGWEQVYVDDFGSVNWVHPSGWWPIKTEI